MRKRLLALIGSVLSIAVCAATVVAASDPYRGMWQAIDVDGSSMHITFSGGGAVREYSFTDERATFCGGDAYGAEGAGTVTGSDFNGVGIAGCLASGLNDPGGVAFTYDAATGTLFDGVLTWYRGNQVEAFLGVWKTTDFDGSAMSLSFGGSGLARDVGFADDAAAFCEPDAPMTGSGEGLIGSVPGDGRFILVSLTATCVDADGEFSSVDKYEYDYTTDALIGPLAPLEVGGEPTPSTLVWHR
jgi:hypothetical protein